MPPPEIHLRVQYEPKQWNRQLKKKYQRRKPAEWSHARILIEAARERK